MLDALVEGTHGSLPDGCPGWGFMPFEPTADGMKTMGFALAAGKRAAFTTV
ncbi:hypothetical protein [Streptomyces sp. MMS24-I29]|uniref:hypothetical protein n=1 Tax=Streptomyces sp. MMS24-I29 TaxID=3351480 RepID=UPI003C7C0725